MVTAARQVIAVVDHTKWDRAAFVTFCRLDDLDVVVTDEGSPEMAAALLQRGIASTSPATATGRDAGRSGRHAAVGLAWRL